ncbi:arylamine N-acetyltransferase, partial [Streptosporangium sp. NPDC048865]|uniref:arylamine N-acetyltransferase n=1 Tax=Streptosporangium sp. NPDC048865 TaxID=3155766 RepID=UPI00341BE3EB
PDALFDKIVDRRRGGFCYELNGLFAELLTALAAEDDWVALGQSVGAFEDPATGTVSTELTGEQKLERSPAVRAYLLDRITVAQGGRRCESRLEELRALVTDGARFVFDCRGPVTQVDVTVSTLTDLNEAYRTMLVAETPATPGQTLLTGAESTRRLTFSGTGGGGLPPGTGIVVWAAVLLAGAGALAVLRRRRGTGGRS